MISEIFKTDRSFFTRRSLHDNENHNDNSLILRCINEIQGKLLERPKIIVYGKECHQNRNIGFFSDTSIGYRYSGQIAHSQPLTPALKELLDYVNKIYGAGFNGILLNQYMNGEDTIGAHSDDERMLDPVGVVCLTHGAERLFRVRNKETKKIVFDERMKSGMLYHMGGDFQKEFTHEIPQEKRVKEMRYSFTFRRHLE
jgi:alkylated DNA repair dioxygenase AlkB